jgi:uncharacterized protein YutE (UPF0331/DUF86 family)
VVGHWSFCLIRLSIEIEKELAQLCREIGKAPSATWRRSVDELVQANIIESPLAKTLTEFRDVRNQVGLVFDFGSA